MKNLFLFAGLVFIGISGYLAFQNLQENDHFLVRSLNSNSATAYNGVSLTEHVEVIPIMHATFALEWGDEVILVDPVDVDLISDITPTLVLVTDIHGDHFNVETLEEIVSDGTVLVIPAAVAGLLPQSLLQNVVVLHNSSSTLQKGFSVLAVPMYNLAANIDSRHPKGRGNGYVIEREGIRVFIAGDTDDIPEIRALEKIDIAFIPMNPPYTMSVEAAAGVVLDFAPRQVYPYHYRINDGLSDVERFKGLVTVGNNDIKVILEDWY